MTVERRRVVERLARAVRTEPLLGSGDVFRSGTARYTIRNDGGSPLSVRGLPERGRDLDPEARPIEVTVAPRQVASVAVPVRARSAHRYETLAPTPVRWTLATQDAAGERVEIATDSLILPEKRFRARRAASAIYVDGDLEEWGELAFDVAVPAEITGHGEYRGPEDASFRFDVRWDDAALYVAVDVRDDSVVAGRELSAREQDHVGVTVDARPDPERSANQGRFEAIRSGVMARLVHVLATLEEPRRDDVMALFAAAPPEGVRFAAYRTPAGYAAEIAIPRELLDERRGGAWDAVRMNVTVADLDAGEPNHVTLAWRPSRFGDRAVPGSGTFARR
jgi:hypothetical protein